MIISNKFRFIFIKTGKTAGTSIEIALSKFCGEDDVITPISVEDEMTRTALGYRGPQNCLVPFSSYTLEDWKHFLVRQDNPLGPVGPNAPPPTRRVRYTNHTSARAIRDHVSGSVWKSYFKFCLVRNPWDKVISRYFFAFPQEPRPSLASAVNSGVLLASDANLYTIDGNLAVDYVGRYEQLEDELGYIARAIGLPESLIPLPKAKTRFRQDRRPYKEVLTVEQRDLIARAFRREIAMFNYEW